MNPLYDYRPEEIDAGLPVERPSVNAEARLPLRFTVHPKNDLTPAPPSSVQDQPTIEQGGYKLVPVEGNPFESMTHKTEKEPELTLRQKKAKEVSKLIAGMPYALGKMLIVDPIKSAAELTNDALAGKFVSNDPENIPKANAAAALGGTGGLAGVPEGLLLSGMGYKELLTKQRELEGFRPAIRDPETRKIYAGKRGEELDHNDIIDNIKDEATKKKFLDDLQSEQPDFKKFGFLDEKGRFVSRDEMEKRHGISDSGEFKSKLNMFRSATNEAAQAEQAIQKLAKAPTFYSAVEHAVENIKQAKAPAEQWLATIQNAKGVKPEELDWTGLKGFLEENKSKSITKQEIQDYVNANKVELKEVNKGKYDIQNGLTDEEFKRRNELQDKINKFESEYNKNGEYSDSKAYHKAYDEYEQLEAKRKPQVETKYGPNQAPKLSLPGGENYRETLLTLPVKTLEPEAFAKQFYDNWVKRGGDPEWEALSKSTQEKWMRAADETNLISKAHGNYQSSHWEEPNILAHVRMNDRMIEGKKSLHLEEIQSDWLQSLRDKGAKLSEKDYNNKQLEFQKQLEDVHMEMATKPPKERQMELHQKEMELTNKWNDLHDAQREGVPDAPFKKTWHELVLKRMIREAAEKGYSKLSWTPGEAQAARYDLSKQVEAIRANKNSDGTYHLMYRPKGDAGLSILGERVPENKLAENVGKELAEKIINQTEDKTYKGLDLKVGGEGMKGFYDQIIPKALEKLGKEHGVKIKTAEIPKPPETDYTTRDANGRNPIKFENQKVHYIDIPQSLKDAALHKGFPLFSSVHPGMSFHPVNGDPFDNAAEKQRNSVMHATDMQKEALKKRKIEEFQRANPDKS